MMTTNHSHAVAAGVGDRRYVVFDVSDARASDETWFGPLYLDLEAGGTSQFLWFLQSLRLGNWHPRQIIKTAEATQQQRMSADSISQWARACIEADAIIGGSQSSYPTSHDLGVTVSSEELRAAYTGYCKQQAVRAVDPMSFGVACTEMFGRRRRLKAQPNSKRRPYGYDVPAGNKWQRKLDTRLGIK